MERCCNLQECIFLILVPDDFQYLQRSKHTWHDCEDQTPEKVFEQPGNLALLIVASKAHANWTAAVICAIFKINAQRREFYTRRFHTSWKHSVYASQLIAS